MKICLFGKNLTNLILSQVLIKKGMSVHMYHQKKNKLAKINYNRTIGLSFENIKFLKKYDIDVEKLGQKISKIFLYKNNAKETFLRMNEDGLLCVQHSVIEDGGHQFFMDFVLFPEDVEIE